MPNISAFIYPSPLISGSFNATSFKGSVNVTKSTVPACLNQCRRSVILATTYYWAPIRVSVTATVTVATVVMIVNPLNNSTRTETVGDANVTLASSKMDSSEAIGTHRTLITSLGGDAVRTTLLAFPTQLIDYLNTVQRVGTLSTSHNGQPTCVKAEEAFPTQATFPVHPYPQITTHVKSATIPVGNTSTIVDDHEGLFYIAASRTGYEDLQEYLQPFMPNLGVWSCAASVASYSVVALSPVATAPGVSIPPSVPYPQVTPNTRTKSESIGAHLYPLGGPQIQSVALSLTHTTVSTESRMAVSSRYAAKDLAGIERLLGSKISATSLSQDSPQPKFQEQDRSNGEMSKRSATSASGILQPSQGQRDGDRGHLGHVNQGTVVSEEFDSESLIPSGVDADKMLEFNIGLSTAIDNTANLTPTGSGYPNGRVLGAGSQKSIPGATTTYALQKIVINGQTITPNSAAQYLISGKTLEVNSHVTIGSGISAQTIGLQPSRGYLALFVGSSASVLGPVEPSHSAQIVVNGETLTRDSASGYVISGQTLKEGSFITVGSGPSAQTIGIQNEPNGALLIIGTSTSQLIAPTIAPPPIEVNGDIITANSAGKYFVSGQVLEVGSSITIGSGTFAEVIALRSNPSGALLVVGTSSSLLTPAAVTPPPITPPITVNGQAVTADSAGQYVVSGRKLRFGSPVTLTSGTSVEVIALTTSGDRTAVIVGTSTSLIPIETAKRSETGLGAGDSPTAQASSSSSGGALMALERSLRGLWKSFTGVLIAMLMATL